METFEMAFLIGSVVLPGTGLLAREIGRCIDSIMGGEENAERE